MAPRKRAAPKIPASVYSALGPIPVIVVDDLKDDKGEPLFGLWDPLRREIKVRKGMHPATALCTAVHEWVHATLHDAGVKLAEKDEEAVADSIATAVTAELLGR